MNVKSSLVGTGSPTELPVFILVVDDDPADADLAVAAFRRADHSVGADIVATRPDFQAALRSGKYELIVCDHDLCSWTGLDALQDLSASGADLPFITLTGTLRDVTAVEYIQRGAAAYVLKDDVAGLPGVARQVLREHRLRQQTRRLEQQLRLQATALTSAANAIAITDANGVIEWVNPAFENLTGFTSAEAIGNKPSILKSGHTEVAVYESLWTTISAGQVWSGEIINRRKDGSTYLEHMTITPVQASEGKVTHYIAIKQDITANRSMEQQLRLAQRMEAVGRLAGGIAHDFNNMLMVISSYADLLMQRSNDPALVCSYTQQIHEAAARAAGITQQLLAFSRKQVMVPSVLDLNQVVYGLIKILRSLLREDIQVDVVAAPDLALIKADSGQLGQILMNLAVNARDAMPTGGRLVIETANVVLDAETLGSPRPPPGHYVMLAVTDNGCGMDEATQSRIFEPFFTTKEPGKGTGLGLATVYGIVKQSGGFVWVYSEPDKGTTFKIYLPRAVEQVASAVVKPVTSVAGVTGGAESVLIVEDEPALREAMSGFLGVQGYKVYTAADAGAASRLFAEHPDIAILITDLVMPGGGGLELARAMEKQRPGLPVIYISGYTENTVDASQFLARGTLLQKPFRLQELAERIRFVLDTPATTASA